jgi:CHAT domain
MSSSTNTDPIKKRTVRMNLDAEYRLWLTIAAGESKDEILIERFLAQVYALREGFVEFASNWAKASELEMISEIRILNGRLSRLTGTVLLVLESGINCYILTTLCSGKSKLMDRVHIEPTSQVCTKAFESLLQLYLEATNGLIDRAIGVQSQPTEAFRTACEQVWLEFPEAIRRDLTGAETILVSPSNTGDVNEIPVELLNDGSDYLGLSKNVVRVISLGQLHATLAENRRNSLPYNRNLIVRAADSPDLGQLSHADSEVQRTQRSMQLLGNKVQILTSPSTQELLVQLKGGVDIMHYVGHGFADQSGEALLLGTREVLTANHLSSIDPTPAPISVMSSCFVGRARHLRTGEQHGIAMTLLEHGASAVVAATYAVPDHVGSLFSLTFYNHCRAHTLGTAMRLARRSLAANGYHPATWGCFIFLGDPFSRLSGLKPAVVDLSWPAGLCRFIATGSQAYDDSARRKLKSDSRLSKVQIQKIESALDAFSSQDSKFFTYKRLQESIGLQSIDMEGYLTYFVLCGIGYLRYKTKARDKRLKEDLLRSLLAAQRILNDSYLLITLVIEAIDLIEYPFTTSEGRSLLHKASSALNWVNSDGSFFKKAQETFSMFSEHLKNTIVFDAQHLAEVDSETFASADAGDRQAQKKMLRNLLTRDASLKALTSTQSWTHWMLRMIGCPTEQATKDLFGVISQASKNKRLLKKEEEALNRLLEQYAGPGEIDEETAAQVLDVFSSKPHERDVIELFIIHDRLASGQAKVSIEEIDRAIQLSKKLGSIGAETYFASVRCQKTAEMGQIEQAIAMGWDVLEQTEKLASEDAECKDRVGLIAILLRQLSQLRNDTRAVNLIDLLYGEAMQAYMNSSQTTY